MKSSFERQRVCHIMVKGLISSVLVVALVLGGGCRGVSAPDVSQVEVSFKLIPFYEELFEIPPDSVEVYLGELKQKYGQYLEAYSVGILGIGSPDDPEYPQQLGRFLAYQPNKEVLDTCRRVFADTDAMEAELTSAFRFYHYYFPDKKVPDVYLHLSGFNQSVAIDSEWVSVSVEKYLGSQNPFYGWLDIPLYLRQRMTPQRVVPDVVQAMGMTEFPFNDSIDDLISHMIYQGQILEFVRHLIPGLSEPLLFGYTPDEYNWCERNEARMWQSMVEKKHLFSTDPMLVRKYVGEAPFSALFGQDSPGRAGRYIGYKLLESWLDRHPQKTIVDLMSLPDPHKILAEAGYRP